MLTRVTIVITWTAKMLTLYDIDSCLMAIRSKIVNLTGKELT